MSVQKQTRIHDFNLHSQLGFLDYLFVDQQATEHGKTLLSWLGDSVGHDLVVQDLGASVQGADWILDLPPCYDSL